MVLRNVETEDLARATGIEINRINNLTRKNSDVRAREDELRKIATALRTTADWLASDDDPLAPEIGPRKGPARAADAPGLRHGANASYSVELNLEPEHLTAEVIERLFPKGIEKPPKLKKEKRVPDGPLPSVIAGGSSRAGNG